MKQQKKPVRRKPILSFVGAGSVGTAFALALSDRGYRVASVISSKVESARWLAAQVGAPIASARLGDLSKESAVVFVTTPDRSIARTATKLAEQEHLDFSGMVFLHTSGALDSQVLSPVAKRGGHVLCLHPIQVFPRTAKPRELAKQLSGICFGLEGDDRGIAMGKKLAGDLDGRTLVIPRDLKSLYHIACVVASNYLVALMSLLEEISTKLGLEGKNFLGVFEDLIGSTLKAVKTSSPRESLTGPIERGEVETVRLHLKELERKLPYLVPFYTVMGMETLRLAVKKGSLTTKQASDLLDAMSGYVQRKVPDELLSYYQEQKN